MKRKATTTDHLRVRSIPELDGLQVLHARLRQHRFPCHFHDTFVIEWVSGGVDRCTSTGFEARAGQLFVHGPRAPHAGESGHGSVLEYRACYPTIGLVADVLGVHESALPALGTQVIQSHPLQRDVERMFRELQEGGSAKLARRALEQVMLRVLDHRGSPAPADGRPRAAVRAARDFLVDNLEREVTTDELADVAGMSRYHFIREFKRALGITPRRFVLSQRVIRARELLAAGAPITAVALRTGFADQSHLTRNFRRTAGWMRFSPSLTAYARS